MSVAMTASVGALSLARWQFAVTTVFHFLFVPLSIGLAFLVALLQTAAYRTGDARWDRMARWWGRLFLVNFAIGVVTGIVQEFQFGMNWSQYSTFVGNIFGAPLAIEGLLAFFMESTFLGVWIFGRERISARLHLATIWLVSIGTLLSAAFILAANAWMQHPVGFRIDPSTHQAVMTDFWAVVTNSTFVGEYAHVVLGALLTGAMVMLGISAWHLRRGNDRAGFGATARVGLVVGTLALLGTLWTGDSQARMMTTQQPMKMAAAEALYRTTDGASFSLLTIGDLSGQPLFQIRVPRLLSVLADNTWNGKVEGIDQIQQQEAARYGPGNYKSVLWLSYWSFRVMVGLGMLLLGVLGWGLWQLRRHRLEVSRRYLRVTGWCLLAPFLANTAGWIFTETGRQPWVVYGLLKTSQAVSPVGTGYVATSLVAYTVVYSVLAVIEVGLMLRLAKEPPGAGDGHGHGAGEAFPGEDAGTSPASGTAGTTPASGTAGTTPASGTAGPVPASADPAGDAEPSLVY